MHNHAFDRDEKILLNAINWNYQRLTNKIKKHSDRDCSIYFDQYFIPAMNLFSHPAWSDSKKFGFNFISAVLASTSILRCVPA